MARVLIVDDEPLIRRLVVDLLRELEVETSTAADGLEAWELLADGAYDLVITDLMMPRSSGYDLIGKITMHGYQVPVIVITGSETIDDVRLRVASVFAVMRKPVDLLELLRATEKALAIWRPAG